MARARSPFDSARELWDERMQRQRLEMLCPAPGTGSTKAELTPGAWRAPAQPCVLTTVGASTEWCKRRKRHLRGRGLGLLLWQRRGAAGGGGGGKGGHVVSPPRAPQESHPLHPRFTAGPEQHNSSRAVLGPPRYDPPPPPQRISPPSHEGAGQWKMFPTQSPCSCKPSAPPVQLATLWPPLSPSPHPKEVSR